MLEINRQILPEPSVKLALHEKNTISTCVFCTEIVEKFRQNKEIISTENYLETLLRSIGPVAELL